MTVLCSSSTLIARVGAWSWCCSQLLRLPQCTPGIWPIPAPTAIPRQPLCRVPHPPICLHLPQLQSSQQGGHSAACLKTQPPACTCSSCPVKVALVWYTPRTPWLTPAPVLAILPRKPQCGMLQDRSHVMLLCQRIIFKPYFLERLFYTILHFTLHLYLCKHKMK